MSTCVSAPRSWVRHIGSLVLVAVALSACSLSVDRQPRDVLAEERPSAANTTTPAAAEPGTGSIVYFLGPAGAAAEAPLVAVGRASDDNPTTVFQSLFDGPSAQEQETLGVRTAIPVGTRLLSAELSALGTLTLDVSADFLAGAGDVLLDAIVQIVYTAAQLRGERRVLLLVEGEPQDWPTSAGTTRRDPLSIFDFPARLPVATLPPSSVVRPNATSTTVG